MRSWGWRSHDPVRRARSIHVSDTALGIPYPAGESVAPRRTVAVHDPQPVGGGDNQVPPDIGMAASARAASHVAIVGTENGGRLRCSGVPSTPRPTMLHSANADTHQPQMRGQPPVPPTRWRTAWAQHARTVLQCRRETCLFTSVDPTRHQAHGSGSTSPQNSRSVTARWGCATSAGLSHADLQAGGRRSALTPSK